MIRIRRIPQRIPIGRLYELELGRPQDAAAKHRKTRAPVSVLEPLLGVGDAWSIVDAANRRWQVGDRGWVEFDESDGSVAPRDIHER
jgi:hypothetical protein